MTTSATLRPGPLAIPPGEAVGGVVLHIYDVVGVLLSTSHLKPGDDIEAAAARAAAQAARLRPADRGVVMVAYDGDTGLRFSRMDWLTWLLGWPRHRPALSAST